MFLYYFTLVVLLLILLMCLNAVIIEKSFLEKAHEDSSSYECGFEHNSLSRVSFSLRYFMLTIVFLVFDMEVVLLVFLPYSLMVSFMSLVLLALLFLVVLILGLVFEISEGSLTWVM